LWSLLTFIFLPNSGESPMHLGVSPTLCANEE
jgi:hypothetical protein